MVCEGHVEFQFASGNLALSPSAGWLSWPSRNEKQLDGLPCCGPPCGLSPD